MHKQSCNSRTTIPTLHTFPRYFFSDANNETNILQQIQSILDDEWDAIIPEYFYNPPHMSYDDAILPMLVTKHIISKQILILDDLVRAARRI